MCLACQMEDELWFAYLEQVARQEKASAADAVQRDHASAAGAVEQDNTLAADAAWPAQPDKPKPAPPSLFACEELPSE